MVTPRIYADFHDADAQGRLRLNSVGSLKDIASQEVPLKEGMRLTLYSDDLDDNGELDELLADGIAAYSTEDDCWVAVIDWDAIYHASDRDKNYSQRNGSPLSPDLQKKPA
jgi:hypothetical protein